MTRTSRPGPGRCRAAPSRRTCGQHGAGWPRGSPGGCCRSPGTAGRGRSTGPDPRSGRRPPRPTTTRPRSPVRRSPRRRIRRAPPPRACPPACRRCRRWRARSASWSAPAGRRGWPARAPTSSASDLWASTLRTLTCVGPQPGLEPGLRSCPRGAAPRARFRPAGGARRVSRRQRQDGRMAPELPQTPARARRARGERAGPGVRPLRGRRLGRAAGGAVRCHAGGAGQPGRFDDRGDAPRHRPRADPLRRDEPVAGDADARRRSRWTRRTDGSPTRRGRRTRPTTRSGMAYLRRRAVRAGGRRLAPNWRRTRPARP